MAKDEVNFTSNEELNLHNKDTESIPKGQISEEAHSLLIWRILTST